MGGCVVDELRVHEVAGHIPDLVWTNMWMQGQADWSCAEYDPNTWGYYAWQFSPGDFLQHNGDYEVIASVTYTIMQQDPNNPMNWQQSYYQVYGGITINNVNPVITSTVPENPNPILWNPDTMAGVDLAVTADGAQRQQQAARVILYDTSQNPVKVLPLDPGALLPGAPATFTVHWDGTKGGDMGGVAPPMPVEAAPKGVYLFKWEFAGDTDKSPFLGIRYTGSKPLDPAPAARVSPFRESYVLTNTSNPIKPASEAHITVYDPDLAVATGPVAGPSATDRPAAPDPLWNYQPIGIPLGKQGPYTHLTCARDGHSSDDYGHRERWALQMQQAPAPPLSCTYDFRGFPPPNPPWGTEGYALGVARLLRTVGPDGTFYEAHPTEDEAQNGTYLNQSAGQALVGLQNSAIFSVFSHGSGTFLTKEEQYQLFWAGNRYTCMVQTQDGANQLMARGMPAQDIVVLDALPGGALNKVLFAAFVGCHTGYWNVTWGAPVRGVVGKGARTSMGFFEEIFGDGAQAPKGAETWIAAFWKALRAGRTVLKAGEVADEALGSRFKLASQLGRREIFPRQGTDGQGRPVGESLVIYPARYGNAQ